MRPQRRRELLPFSGTAQRRTFRDFHTSPEIFQLAVMKYVRERQVAPGVGLASCRAEEICR